MTDKTNILNQAYVRLEKEISYRQEELKKLNSKLKSEEMKNESEMCDIKNLKQQIQESKKALEECIFKLSEIEKKM